MTLLDDLNRPVNLFDGTHSQEEVQAYLAHILKWTKIWASLLGVVTFHCIALSLFFGYHFWWRRGNEIYRLRRQCDTEDPVLRSWMTPQMQHHQQNQNSNEPHPDLKAFSKPGDFTEHDRRLCSIEEVEEKAVTADSSTSVAGLGILDALSSEQHTWKYSTQQRLRGNTPAEHGDRLVMNEATAITGIVDNGAQYKRGQQQVANSPLSRQLSFSRPRPLAMVTKGCTSLEK